MMKEKVFVDTNIFIYFFFPVDQKKFKKCEALFEKVAKGEVVLWTTEWVIAELIWFMIKNKTTWEEVKKAIIGILTTKNLEVRNKQWVNELIGKCQKGEDFVDAVNISLSLSENIKSGHSYDKGFDKWKEFKRIEP